VFIVPEGDHLVHRKADVAGIDHTSGEGALHIERLADAGVEAQTDTQRAVGLHDGGEDPQAVDFDRDALAAVEDDGFVELIEDIPYFAPVERGPAGDVAGQLRGLDQLPEREARAVFGQSVHFVSHDEPPHGVGVPHGPGAQGSFKRGAGVETFKDMKLDFEQLG